MGRRLRKECVLTVGGVWQEWSCGGFYAREGTLGLRAWRVHLCQKEGNRLAVVAALSPRQVAVGPPDSLRDGTKTDLPGTSGFTFPCTGSKGMCGTLLPQAYATARREQAVARPWMRPAGGLVAVVMETHTPCHCGRAHRMPQQQRTAAACYYHR